MKKREPTGKEKARQLDRTDRTEVEERLRRSEEIEEELSIQSRNLEELTVALKVLLRQREEDRVELQEQVLANVKTLILPCIEKMKEGALTPLQRDCPTLERQCRNWPIEAGDHPRDPDPGGGFPLFSYEGGV